MVAAAELAGRLAADPAELSALKRQGQADPKAALRGAAKQFEALFLNMVLKSMRDASPQESMFDSEQSRLFQGMLDQQLATTLAARGASGLAALIEKQLGRALPGAQPGDAAAGAADTMQPASRFPLDTLRGAGRQILDESGVVAAGSAATAPASGAGAPRAFVDRVWPHAVEASRATGIPAHFLVAQAALETGWGRAEIRTADGGSSHNLFNIKAGRSWTGAVAESATTEYLNGVPQRLVERFRAYGSYAEAFGDYARLIAGSPRYAHLLGRQDAAEFARGLQRAGYATDPAYAQKLERLIGSDLLRRALSS